jgi:hypothetical protein
MLYSDYTKILVTNYNKSKIEKQFGDKLNIEIDEYLKIPVYLLPDGSGYKIEALCNFCEKVYNTEWRKYLKIENKSEKHCCDSKECINKKRKETLLKKWGVDNPMKSNEVKKKIEKSILDKWGVDHYSKTDEFKEKIKETSLDKWGVDHYSKTDEFKDKFKETSLNNWGVDNPSKSEIIKEKVKEISLDKWGVDNYSKTDEFKDKIKQTSLDKWGVDSYSKTEECKGLVRCYFLDKFKSDNPMKTESIKLKQKNTIKDKWGVDNYTKTEEYLEKTKKSNLERWGNKNITSSEIFRSKFYNISNHKGYIKYIGNSTSLFKFDKKHNFVINSSQYHNRIRENIPLCTVCNPIGDSQSIKEKELYKFIKSIYKDEIIQSYRDGLEIDIYLPELNLGFEFNGLYWHSDKFKDKLYHLSKTKHFKEKGIRIIHIWEDSWSLNSKIIKSQVSNWLGLTENKIFARKCYVKEIKDSNIATNFLEENHVQGKVGSSLKLGLYNEGELVSLMTFDRYEGRKKMEDGGWNINRFCNKIDYNIIGGASKLFKYFLNNYNVNRVISYSDRDWSEGDLYKKLGFNKVNSSDPDYKYIIEGMRVHKSRFRKSKTGISENKLNINKIWDCGKIKWEFII